MLSYDTLNNVFKINWLIQYLKNKDSIWNSFPNYLFKQLGDLEFLLKCNYSIEKIPVTLAKFHKQALMAWMLAYKHNFSPRRYYIWNNKDILYKNKSLYFDYWFGNNIIVVSQLLNNDGVLLTYKEFFNTFRPGFTDRA